MHFALGLVVVADRRREPVTRALNADGLATFLRAGPVESEDGRSFLNDRF